MAICPHCETISETVLASCPSGDGYYCIDETEFASYSDDPLLGQRIADRFIVSSVLGRGSMGKVYKAFQDQVDRDVALKVFRSETLVKHTLGRNGTAKEREAARARFVQEAKVLGQLSHPNCVTVYDFGMGEDDDFLYMAMEFVGGVSLREAVNRGFKFEAIVEITRQILQALREAHSLGIVHRDLKPENIVLSYRFNTGEHVVKVLDFGIAKLLQADAQSLTRAGALFGTPAYMSPEQCRGELDTIGPQVDVYALGCILYEMVCRQLPYAAQLPQQMVRLHQEAEIPALDPGRGIDVPDGLEGFIHRCLQKDHRDRFADANAAMRAFEEVLADAGELGAGNLDSEGLGSMARTIQKRSGTTHGARSVIVPKDRVSGDVLDPLGRSIAPPFLPNGKPASFDHTAMQKTPPSNAVPSNAVPSNAPPNKDRKGPGGPKQDMSPPKVSVPGTAFKRANDTVSGALDDNDGRSPGKKSDRQALIITGALLAVLVCCALVFYLIYSSIMQS
jgi:serine/threonine-protein kinase